MCDNPANLKKYIREVKRGERRGGEGERAGGREDERGRERSKEEGREVTQKETIGHVPTQYPLNQIDLGDISQTHHTHLLTLWSSL
jgi:hypothetical protein